MDENVEPQLVANVMSSSQTIRRQQAQCSKEEEEVKAPALRDVDKQTGALHIVCSSEELMQWVPKLPLSLVATWSKMPIFLLKLYLDKQTYEHSDRSYAEQVFPNGEDLLSCIQWWRRRVNHEGKGFAVFEGGFDETGPVLYTEPPRFLVDAATGDVIADDADEIERKRMLHNKRKAVLQKWNQKGTSQEMLKKMEAADEIIKEKRRRGVSYMLKGGWVVEKQCDKDLQRHNEIQKLYG